MIEVTQAATEAFRHPWLAGLIFVGTFVLISFRRLSMLPIGRPSAALLGAVLMVAFGVVEPEEAYRLVNWDTICLLLGMMIVAEHLRAAGLFDIFSRLTEKIYSPFGLLVLVGAVAALSSAVLVNDPVCVVMTPLVLEICRRKRLKPLPYLIMLATSSNIGSSLTLTGNPQNMIIGNLSKLGFLRFMLLMAAPFCAAMLVNVGLAWLFYRNGLKSDDDLPVRPADAIPRESRPEGIIKTRRLRIGLTGLAVACAGFVCGFSMAFSALAGAVIVITFHREDPSELLEKMEWSLLMFFAALFVVIGGLQTSGLARALTEWSLRLIAGDLDAQVWIFSGVTLVGSNLLSNVPFVLLASQSVPQMTTPELFWCLLGFVSTIAGNLTIFGSVANMIVAETARNDCPISFWAFARFGIPSTILSLLAGVWLLSHILTMAL